MPGMFKLSIRDFILGLIVAVGAAVFAQLASVFNVPGFDIALFDWSTLIPIAVSAAIGYFNKNFFSDSHGNFAGKKIK